MKQNHLVMLSPNMAPQFLWKVTPFHNPEYRKNKTSGKQALPDDNINRKWKPNEEKRDTNTKEVRLKVEMNSSFKIRRLYGSFECR